MRPCRRKPPRRAVAVGRARSSWTASTAEPHLATTDAALAAAFARVWTSLAAAVADRGSPLRTPVVATGGADGPDARVMVLRAVDAGEARLTFFTDARAAKVAAVTAGPRVAVVGWDPCAELQLRLCGTATIATAGAAVDAAWASVPSAARRAYRTVAAPGSPLPTPDFDEGWDGRRDFAVLTVAVDGIDLLDLAGPSHRRAAFSREGEGGGGWSGGWRVP